MGVRICWWIIALGSRQMAEISARFTKNNIIDNTDLYKMSVLLNEYLQSPKYSVCKIATGFWDIPGLGLLCDNMRSFLDRDKNNKIQLIIGKDPEIRAYQLHRPKDWDDYPEGFLKRHLEEISNDLKEQYKNAIRFLMQYCESEQFEIKVYGYGLKEQFLHAKCYIFMGEEDSVGIIGSSNFTLKGLTENAELNYLETQSGNVVAEPKEGSIQRGHVYWFNSIWNSELAQPWTKTFLLEILKKSTSGETVDKEIHDPTRVTPYETYIRVCHEEYGSLLDANVAEIIKGYLPEAYQKYDYQIQGVQWCAHIMQHFNGFMLSDVVGLGKTIIGVLLAKYYVEQIAPQMNREKNILIIAPPTILKDWEHTIDDFDKNRDDKLKAYITPISIGSIDKAELSLDDDDIPEFDDVNDENKIQENGCKLDLTEATKEYGLILIDESHRFRHSNTVMYKSLDALIDAHSEKPYIGLISATPQNNEPQDLYNQIKLFERTPKNSHFEKVDACNIESFFGNMRKQYDELKRAKTDDMSEAEIAQNKQALIVMSEEIRNKVLYDIMVRRTRSDITKYYQSSISFPVIDGPNNIKYELEGDLALLFNDTIKKLVGEPVNKDNVQTTLNGSGVIGFYRYRATEFLKSDEDKNKYEGGGAKVDTISLRLANIMKILLVKRLESSFVAFKESLQNLKEYTQNMIDMWEHNKIYICPQIDVNAVFRKVKEEAEKTNQWDDVFETVCQKLDEKIGKLKPESMKDKNKCYQQEDFIKDNNDNYIYIDKLRSDLRMIHNLYDRWVSKTYDPKLEAFKDALRDELFDPQKNVPQKLVIFTEAVATAEELKCHIEHMKHRPLVITADNRDDLRKVIQENFDANYDDEQKEDYDVIITTDVLAEGINLHRANTILNYDTPWNATRLIQRIGRVNRIGSKQPVVYVYNFYPSEQGNAEINLKQNAFAKLQAFHAQFGGDNKVYSDAEVIPEADYNHWMDEVDGGESPVQKHIRNLKAFKEKDPLRYEALCQMNSDIVTEYEADENESYHIIKTSPNASGCFAVRFSEGKGTHIPVLELLDHIECDQKTQRTVGTNNIDTKAVLDVYRNSKNKHQKQKETKEDISAKSILDIWRKNYSLSEETLRKLDVLYGMIEGGDHSVSKKINQYHAELEQRDLMLSDEARIANWVVKLTPNVPKDIDDPYLLASIIHTKLSD